MSRQHAPKKRINLWENAQHKSASTSIATTTKKLNLWENILYRSDKIIAELVKKDNQLCPGILSGLLSPRITVYK